MARISLLLQLLSWTAFTLAFDIVGRVSWNDVCPNVKALGQARASLDEGVYNGGITVDGRFTIPDVPEGIYLLSIISHDFTFDQLRIDVTNASLPQVRPYISGTPMDPPSPVLLPYPIVLSAREKAVYFVPPESFNLAAMFSNPMMLLMVGAAVMMLGMPYLIKNMDPEALEELKEQQAKMGSLQNALQSGDIKADLSSIMAAAEEQAAGTSTGTQRGGAKSRGSKKTKR